jgi:hypothetical protein
MLIKYTVPFRKCVLCKRQQKVSCECKILRAIRFRDMARKITWLQFTACLYIHCLAKNPWPFASSLFSQRQERRFHCWNPLLMVTLGSQCKNNLRSLLKGSFEQQWTGIILAQDSPQMWWHRFALVQKWPKTQQLLRDHIGASTWIPLEFLWAPNSSSVHLAIYAATLKTLYDTACNGVAELQQRVEVTCMLIRNVEFTTACNSAIWHAQRYVEIQTTFWACSIFCC